MATTADTAVDYSIVIPVYFNEGALTETMTSIKSDVIARNPALCCEVIFVDDGSGKVVSMESSRWSLQELIPGPGYVAALAVEGHGWRLACWEWPEQ